MTTKCPQAIDILWKLNAIEVGVTIQEFESMKPFSIIPTGVRKLLTFSFSTYTYLNQIKIKSNENATSFEGKYQKMKKALFNFKL